MPDRLRPLGVSRCSIAASRTTRFWPCPATIPITTYFDHRRLSQHYLKEVEHFFHIYKDLEGRRVEIIGWEKSEMAARVINESIVRYQEQYHQVGT